MHNNRRNFLRASAACGVGLLAPGFASGELSLHDVYRRLDAAANRPVFRREHFAEPVMIESVELLRYRDNFICRVRSKDGAEGLSVGHNNRMKYLHPIQTQRVQPYFVGKDARDLDALIDGVYLYQNNYKLQNMAFWIPVATVEFAILDMLGNIAGRPITELIGETNRNRISIYRANNLRGRSAVESIKVIKARAEETAAKAVKFKIGGRMLAEEQPPGRTERLIPLMRETFGPDMTIYADANGAYTADEAIRIGRILDEYQIDLFEGPVPFDWYEDIAIVADALTIPLAGGGQEASMRNFRWLIARRAFEYYQQDLFYFGGMIRCMKVARMAAELGMPCCPHISGTGLGYLYMLQFVAAITNPGPYHEFKGVSRNIPFHCDTSSLKSIDGQIKVPTGPGDGIDVDPAFVAKHRIVKS
ncbi:mandelate racemase/muconate lactonizing enzyme family protein [Stratiformator vulcanicus]|uniref:Isomerase YitF n=1 Tax=Stratiformator vulcanicus TaxID=2527980 RepID=A0A517QY44_9PLAN|nr:mandelate racemase/muconate lactonizing enzyme family protein [Stratiformator vulcanicus]QDT36518.1 Putative isomerase YitF [Stratiformator vulcanicus]